jgi:hypothetical protein
MTKRKYKEPCYYCGGQACSDEHAPPQQMFKGFSCDSITVPSCKDHNSAKSGADQAIVSAFLIPLHNGIGRYPLEDEVLKAIQIAEPSFDRAKRRAINSPLLRTPPGVLKDLPNLAYLVPTIDIGAWVRQLTAALVYDAIHIFDSAIQWSEAVVWSPDWITAKGPASLELEQAISILGKQREIQVPLEQLTWENGWSAYPRPYPSVIYAFQVHFEPNRKVIFRHRFYNRYSWYAWFSTSQETIAKLKEILET